MNLLTQLLSSGATPRESSLSGRGRPIPYRLDNFWFCLLHKLAHVRRHMDKGGGTFIDDLTLRKVDTGKEDPREKEADEWVQEACIPQPAWEASAVRHRPTSIAVLNLAAERQIYPVMIAGRVRYERKNYQLLSQFVGTREVRKQFDKSNNKSGPNV